MTKYVTCTRLAAIAGLVAVATLAPQVSADAAVRPATGVACQVAGGGVGQHTLSMRCYPAANIKHWRIEVVFCTTANCNYVGGTTQTVSGAVSTASSSGAYVNGASDGGPDFKVDVSTT